MGFSPDSFCCDTTGFGEELHDKTNSVRGNSRIVLAGIDAFIAIPLRIRTSGSRSCDKSPKTVHVALSVYKFLGFAWIPLCRHRLARTTRLDLSSIARRSEWEDLGCSNQGSKQKEIVPGAPLAIAAMPCGLRRFVLHRFVVSKRTWISLSACLGNARTTADSSRGSCESAVTGQFCR